MFKEYLRDPAHFNVQVYPSTVRVDINDKATKILFAHNDSEYQKLMAGERWGIVEKKSKSGKIKSVYSLHQFSGVAKTEPLNQFDRAVLSVCISEWMKGNRYTTPAIIYRGLTGKVGKEGCILRINQKNAIINAIDKLMTTIFTYDQTQLIEESKKYSGAAKFKSAILPCCYVENKINGKDATMIFFDRESPLLTIADIKSQILRYDCSLLDVPNQNNTPLVISLKNYTMRRVAEIIKHKMTPTITLSDVFSKCGVGEEINRKLKRDARLVIDELLKYLQIREVISKYAWETEQGKYRAVKIAYEKSKVTKFQEGILGRSRSDANI